MLTTHYLRRVLEAKPCEAPKVAGVILHEDFAYGLRLKHAFDNLFEEVFARIGWAACYRLSLWSFQMLRVRVIASLAADESASATILAVAVANYDHMSPEVVTLLRQWLSQRDGQSSAMVLAGYGDDPIRLRGSAAGTYLRLAAKRTGTIFLVRPLGKGPFPSSCRIPGGGELNLSSSRQQDSVELADRTESPQRSCHWENP